MGEAESLVTKSQLVRLRNFGVKPNFRICRRTKFPINQWICATKIGAGLWHRHCLKAKQDFIQTAVLGNDQRESYKQIRPQIANIGIMNGQLPQTLVGVVGL
jgi:hypothetical protein